jgi:hypothetical protein
MSTDWQAVFLDLLLIGELGLIGVWFSGNLMKLPMRILSMSFIGMGISLIVLLLGDVMMAFDVDNKDMWFLNREWRALPWRYGFVIGLAAVAGVLRFGTFNGAKSE